jgi:polysaccharide transporter, PST family
MKIPNALKSISWATAAQIVLMVSGILANALAARGLGPQEYGRLSFVMALSYLAMPLARMGLDMVLQRDLVDPSIDNRQLLADALILRLLAGIAASALVLVAAGLLRGWTASTFAVAVPVAAITVLGAAGLLNCAFQTIGRWDLYFHVSVVSAVASLTGAGLAIYVQGQADAFAWAKVIEAAVTSIAALVLIRRILPDRLASAATLMPQTTRMQRIASLAVTSVPFLASSIAVAVYARIDQVMIGQLMDDRALGLYAVCMQIMTGWYMIGSVVISVARPAILSWSDAPEVVDAKFLTLFQLTVLYGGAVIISNVLFGSPLIAFVFGPHYADAYPILVILSATAMFASLGGARTIFILHRRLDNLYPITTIAGMIISIALNLLLIPQFGLKGAAVASLASMFVAGIGTCFLFSPLRPVGNMMVAAMLWPFSILRESRLSDLFARRVEINDTP